jgi:cobalt-zinc-cadmium efflux system outer membrane protein
MVTQPLPYPGKRDLRAAVAGHEADAEAQQLDALRLDVRSRVKQAYARLAFATSAAELLERNRQVIDTLLSTTEARYSVGKTAQADVFKAQSELTAIELRLERVQHTRIAREAELNALTDRPASNAIAHPPPLALPEFTLSLDAVLAAGARTPMLRRDEAMVSRAAAAIDVARRDFKPDFAVSGGYYYMGSMPAMYMVRFDIELPVQRAQRQLALEERESTLGESRAGLDATRRAVESSLQDDYHMAMSEARLARIYRDTMLPQLRLAFESSLASYETGAADFLSVLTSFTGLLDQEMSYLESLSEYHVAIARLEAVTGATETP